MFYEQNSVNKKLICSNCKKRFNVPKLLPCGESICETCLNKLMSSKKSTIQCVFCKCFHHTKHGFPTQKLLLELLNIKPINVYRGAFFSRVEQLHRETQANLDSLDRAFNNKIPTINSVLQQIRDELHLNNSVSNIHELNAEVDNYEQECFNNLNRFFNLVELAGFVNTSSFFSKHFLSFISNALNRISIANDCLGKADLNETQMSRVHQFLYYLNIAIKVQYGYLQSILLNQRNIAFHLVPSSRIEYTYLNDYFDIVDINCLMNANEKESYRIINYKNNPYFNNDYLLASKREIKHIWISIFHNNSLIVFLQVYNHLMNKYEVLAKLLNSNGDLVSETCLNKTETESLMLLSVANTNMFKLQLNYFIVAIENVASAFNELYLLDSSLCLVSKLRIGYTPILVCIGERYAYVLSKEIPFIHQVKFNSNELVECNAFGQNKDPSGKFYMTNNIKQICSKYNDELLYVYFCNEVTTDDDCSIGVYSLSSCELMRLIKVDLFDYLIYIDSLLRLLIVNKTKKVLYIYNEVECTNKTAASNNDDDDDSFLLKQTTRNVYENNLELLYECNLSFIEGNISTFCITNGHMLINDSTNRLIYII